MAIDQILNVAKDYFPATLGAIIGAWNKRDSTVFSFSNFKINNLSDKLFITLLAIFAIVVGVFLGKLVSVALIGYYHLPQHIVPIIEFVTALNGIKIIDGLIKAVDKSIDSLVEKVPSIIGTILDSVSNKIKKWFE